MELDTPGSAIDPLHGHRYPGPDIMTRGSVKPGQHQHRAQPGLHTGTLAHWQVRVQSKSFQELIRLGYRDGSRKIG